MLRDSTESGELVRVRKRSASSKTVVVVTCVLALVWTGLALGAGWATIREENAQIEQIAVNQARGLFQQIVDVRAWVAALGGVYVDTETGFEPNPYLAADPRRDLKTIDRHSLTLVNPAMLTRQVSDIGRGRRGVHMRITAHNPVRAANGPDAWESGALNKLVDGSSEYWEFVDGLDGDTRADVEDADEPYFRYIAPLVVERGCLRCHGDEGLKVGDLRGGISVAIPSGQLLETARQRNVLTSVILAVVWVLGFGLLLSGSRWAISRRRLIAELHDLSLNDPLTGVLNRRGFEQRASDLRRVGRSGTRFVLFFIDVDGLKTINDSAGHAVGDQVLQAVAAALRAAFRSSDAIGRIGGDEFVVGTLLPDKKPASVLVQRLGACVAAESVALEKTGVRIPGRGDKLALRVSVGFVESSERDGRSLAELIKVGDEDMYRRRHLGSATSALPALASLPDSDDLDPTI